MKQAAGRAMRTGAEGVMIQVAGRLGGSEMGRVDTIRDGQVPRHTLRAESITAPPRPVPHTASSVSRPGSIMAKCCPVKSTTPAMLRWR